ncbi:GNAT superfamily N-acetyltransferase [Parvibaculum indicum]|uniref:GNAT family N-acetyltransferase n=1 Tax=Parvibaculum indicum TaxID=562969 RepID=UPI001424A5C3|nr:GNAT family N-acetyltransferase [Parvibaculum indicum]NIJ42365.1 GNAT superfamily N-acetyltransferase [Parvibaculum indicum]
MNATHDISLSFRPVGAADRALLEELVRAYYDFDDHEYEPALHGRALDAICAGDPNVRAWIVQDGETVAGYLILTIGFSMQYGGRDGFLDELFLTEAYRGKGLGRQVMAFLEAEVRRLGFHYLHLEVVKANERARRLYESLGWEETGCLLMSKRLVE